MLKKGRARRWDGRDFSVCWHWFLGIRPFSCWLGSLWIDTIFISESRCVLMYQWLGWKIGAHCRFYKLKKSIVVMSLKFASSRYIKIWTIWIADQQCLGLILITKIAWFENYRLESRLFPPKSAIFPEGENKIKLLATFDRTRNLSHHKWETKHLTTAPTAWMRTILGCWCKSY